MHIGRHDAQGKQLFESTNFKTSIGGPVERPQCDFFSEWSKNNTEAYQVHLPENGESYVTDAGRDGLFGPLRNCGLQQKKKQFGCQPGNKITVECSIPMGSPAQI